MRQVVVHLLNGFKIGMVVISFHGYRNIGLLIRVYKLGNAKDDFQ